MPGAGGRPRGCFRSLSPPSHRAGAHGRGAGAGSEAPPRLHARDWCTRRCRASSAATLEKSEALFRKALARGRPLDQRPGRPRAHLAQARAGATRRAGELEAVAAEREPRNLADWTMKDSREARELLSTLGTGAYGRAPGPPTRARPTVGRLIARPAPGATGLANHLARRGGRPAARPLPRAHRLPALAPDQGRDHRPRPPPASSRSPTPPRPWAA
jgi:hypothetical protein